MWYSLKSKSISSAHSKGRNLCKGMDTELGVVEITEDHLESFTSWLPKLGAIWPSSGTENIVPIQLGVYSRDPRRFFFFLFLPSSFLPSFFLFKFAPLGSWVQVDISLLRIYLFHFLCSLFSRLLLHWMLSLLDWTHDVSYFSPIFWLSAFWSSSWENWSPNSSLKKKCSI